LSEQVNPSASFIETLAQIANVERRQLMQAYSRVSMQETQDSSPQLINGVTRLYKSHRFDAKSAIGQLANAVKEKDVSLALGILNERDSPINWQQSERFEHLIDDTLPVLEAYCHAVIAGDLKRAFTCLRRQQILCSHRKGAWGVEQVNRRIELALAKCSLLALETTSYRGRPIMIAQNSSVHHLFNGDIGIIAEDPDNKTLLKAWFETPDGQLRGILLNQLPAHETVFAMTIHKSQGSEYDKVVLCLANERSKLIHLSRSLLYTGLTRSKTQLTVFSSKEALKSAILTDV
jgi:exodeoxyribonuclease V alpha subunit